MKYIPLIALVALIISSCGNETDQKEGTISPDSANVVPGSISSDSVTTDRDLTGSNVTGTTGTGTVSDSGNAANDKSPVKTDFFHKSTGSKGLNGTDTVTR